MAAIRRAPLTAALLIASLPFTTVRSWAHEHDGCAMVNNTSNNRVSVFEVLSANGALRKVQEVPTRGFGNNGGYYSIPQIAASPSVNGRACLFAANSQSNDVTAFLVKVEHERGEPCPCSNTPVGLPVGLGAGAAFGPRGGGLALHPSGDFLFTANPASRNISVFRVADNCGLTLIPTFQLDTPGPASDIQIKSDGRCMAVAVPETDSVVMYPVGIQSLPLPGPIDQVLPVPPSLPFRVPGPGVASGVEFSTTLEKDSLYVTKADLDSTVIVRYTVSSGCRLESPTVTVTTKSRSATLAKLDPENTCLFVPNQKVSLLWANHPSSSLTSFSVDQATGELTYVGTFDDPAFYPAGIAFAKTSNGEKYLYSTSFSREILRRRLNGCVPSPPLDGGVRSSSSPAVPDTGLLRTLTIVQ